MRNGILAAGNWILDKVKTIDRWPGEGNLCNIVEETRAPGGGPCNLLFDLAAIDPDLPLYAAGRVGDDDDGNFLLNELRRRHIDSRWMIRSRSAATAYTDVMSGGGRRTFFHCRGANAEFNPADLDGVDLPARFFYLGYLLLLDALDTDDPEYGTAGSRLLARMSEAGCRTVVDFVSEAPEKFRRIIPPALPWTDILIINEIEASHCLGRELRRADGSLDWAGLVPAAEGLLAAGVRQLAVIHFPEGALALERGGTPVYAPSCRMERSEIVGSTGAGDAFAAGVLYGLHEDLPLREALDLGSASSRFNLLSPTASDGAVSLSVMRNYLKECEFTPLPEIFQ